MLEQYHAFATAKFERIKGQFVQQAEGEDPKPPTQPTKRWAKAAKQEAQGPAASSPVELQPPLLAEVEENPREVIGYLMEEGSQFCRFNNQALAQ